MTGLLEQVLAQATAVETLRRSLSSGRVHHALIFDGPDGVGKGLAAFGLAQALVCQRRAAGTAAACGECSACTRAVPRGDGGLSAHPDVIVVERGAYDPAAIGRRTPETQDISIDQVRTLVLARAAFPPHEGRARVYVVRRAEELSLAAANALLKTLEEPTNGTHFVLVTSQYGALLPTIRSRALRVRFGQLPDDALVAIAKTAGVVGDLAKRLAPLAGGSASNLLELADPERTAEREDFVARALEAVDAPHVGPALDLAAEAKQAKDGLADRLGALAAKLASMGKAPGPDGSRAAERHREVVRALRELDRNASAQLAVESMVLRMRAIA